MKNGKNGHMTRLELPDKETMERMQAEQAERQAEQQQARAVGAFRATLVTTATAILAAEIGRGHAVTLYGDDPIDDAVSKSIEAARKLLLAAGKVPVITNSELSGEAVTPEA